MQPRRPCCSHACYTAARTLSKDNIMVTLPIPKLSLDPPAAKRTTMKALVYVAPGEKALQDRPIPELAAATDAIVRVVKTTICGSDLHILKGDVSTCAPGRILGHEGIGTIAEIGDGVTTFRVGDRVLIS